MTMIEKVARAIWGENAPAEAPDFDDLEPADQHRVALIAYACIEAMLEPTGAMMLAGIKRQQETNIILPGVGNSSVESPNGFYRAMIEAALNEEDVEPVN